MLNFLDFIFSLQIIFVLMLDNHIYWLILFTQFKRLLLLFSYIFISHSDLLIIISLFWFIVCIFFLFFTYVWYSLWFICFILIKLYLWLFTIFLKYFAQHLNVCVVRAIRLLSKRNFAQIFVLVDPDLILYSCWISFILCFIHF